MSITFVENQTRRIDFRLNPKVVEAGIYTIGIYYCYLQGCEGDLTPPSKWHSNWHDWCNWLVGYEANLIVNYIKAQGLPAIMPINFIEKIEVPSSYLDANGRLIVSNFARDILRVRPDFNTVDLHVCIGENNYNMGAWSLGHGTVLIRGWTLEQEIRAMQGESAYSDMVYCELAHELGHTFRLSHCHTPPCPMGQAQITYDEWVEMGKMLWFCNVCRPTLLDTWENRNFI